MEKTVVSLLEFLLESIRFYATDIIARAWKLASVGTVIPCSRETVIGRKYFEREIYRHITGKLFYLRLPIETRYLFKYWDIHFYVVPNL